MPTTNDDDDDGGVLITRAKNLMDQEQEMQLGGNLVVPVVAMIDVVSLNLNETSCGGAFKSGWRTGARA